ncbi:MAG: hypothetical protein QM529_04075 [Hydrotalea sp.]|nr:hypothetical protein [Hydrotalea sp.]
MKIFCLGFGFCANGLWHDWRDRRLLAEYIFYATYRDDDKKKLLLEKNILPVGLGGGGDINFADALAETDVWLASAAPARDGAGGDPFMAEFGAVIKKLAATKKIIYLSTTGVYGNHNGDWVDEQTILRASHDRSKRRIIAEEEWRAVGATILRLGGIYGAVLDGMGQNTLRSIINGTARRVEKTGQVFGRIHVADIAQAIDLVIHKNIRGEVFNLVDDEPANPRLVVDYGYELLARALPPLEHFDDVKHSMSPMAQSFFHDNKRVKNDKIKKIGWQPQYPSYREGLQMIKNTLAKELVET